MQCFSCRRRLTHPQRMALLQLATGEGSDSVKEAWTGTSKLYQLYQCLLLAGQAMASEPMTCTDFLLGRSCDGPCPYLHALPEETRFSSLGLGDLWWQVGCGPSAAFGGTVSLMDPRRDPKKITVTVVLPSRFYSLTVRSDDKVSAVRRAISQKEGWTTNNYFFVYKAKPLREECTPEDAESEAV